MATSKKPRKKRNHNKTLTVTPLTVRYSKNEGNILKFRIYFHLHRIASSDANAGDWLAIKFRLEVGILLSDFFLEKEKIDSLIHDALTLLDKIKERRESNGTWQITTEAEFQLRFVLSIVDDIQDNTTRKEQLPAFISAQKKIDHSLFETLP